MNRRHFIHLATTALIGANIGCVQAQESKPEVQSTLRVFHVGNSVTDTIRYDALKAMAESRGHKHIYGRHMIPGAPLEWIWEHADSGFRSDEFGYYPQALPGFAWDAITLQPFDRHLKDDVKFAKRYIDLARQKAENANTQFYIYSRWPRRKETKNADGTITYELDYAAKWNRPYTGNWDGTEETKAYFETLVEALRKEYPDMKKPVLLVPVGDVLLELDKRMRDGKIANWTSIEALYSDGIHFNNVGSFIVGTTFYATLYKQNPLGLGFDSYNVVKAPADKAISPAFAKAVQETVWEVVSKHPLAGVQAKP